MIIIKDLVNNYLLERLVKVIQKGYDAVGGLPICRDSKHIQIRLSKSYWAGGGGPGYMLGTINPDSRRNLKYNIVEIRIRKIPMTTIAVYYKILTHNYDIKKMTEEDMKQVYKRDEKEFHKIALSLLKFSDKETLTLYDRKEIINFLERKEYITLKELERIRKKYQWK